MKQITILYHGNCPDGFGAAWAAYKKFGAKATYTPVYHGAPPPDGLAGREVYLLDFSYGAEEMAELSARASRLTAIDHHVSHAKVVESMPHHVYALDRSGAALAWLHFHPGTTVPRLIRYLEDRDLWRFKLPGSDALNSAIETYPFEFRRWSALARLVEDASSRRDLIRSGGAILAYRASLVDRALSDLEEVTLSGHRAGAVNSPILRSEIGHAIVSRGFPVGIIWSFDADSEIIVSLRSDGKTDVSRIAASYGGGGHRAAAAFSVHGGVEKLPWRRA